MLLSQLFLPEIDLGWITKYVAAGVAKLPKNAVQAVTRRACKPQKEGVRMEIRDALTQSLRRPSQVSVQKLVEEEMRQRLKEESKV